jgi:hypothetical protein
MNRMVVFTLHPKHTYVARLAFFVSSGLGVLCVWGYVSFCVVRFFIMYINRKVILYN